MALLSFGIPALTSRTPFVAASNALDSGRRLTNDQVGRDDRPLPGLNDPAGGDRRAARGGVRPAACARPCQLALARGRGPLGGRRDRLRAARLAGAGPLHVRGRGRGGRARRNIRGPGTGRPATMGAMWPLARDGRRGRRPWACW